ncbi:hypothetical protein B8W66_10040 [Mycobacterium decipiens]|uniref:Uncharacterized protein n=1 Tax=Mycobacterium decipiens TaxID=1430326 RepID=A0A1X2LVS7_9MYCO|nr:hypothetical protein B8W66_10040 [Mycobacterium decipiens]
MAAAWPPVRCGGRELREPNAVPDWAESRLCQVNHHLPKHRDAWTHSRPTSTRRQDAARQSLSIDPGVVLDTCTRNS